MIVVSGLLAVHECTSMSHALEGKARLTSKVRCVGKRGERWRMGKLWVGVAVH